MNRICFLAILMIFAGGGVRVCGGTLEDDLAQLLSQITSEKDISKAAEIADEARQLLSSRSSEVNTLVGGFLEADIALTMSKRYAAEINADPSNSEFREDARLLLEWAVESYSGLGSYAKKIIEDALEKNDDGDVDPLTQFKQVRLYLSRAINSVGWSYYYLAILDDQPRSQRKLMHDAMKNFAVLVSDKQGSETLALDSRVGMAMCLIEQKKYSAALRVLDIEHFNGAADTTEKNSKWITYLRVRSAVGAGANVDAVNYADQYFNGLADSNSLSDSDIQIASARLGALAELSQKNEDNPYYKFYAQRFETESDKALFQGVKMAAYVETLTKKFGIKVSPEKSARIDLARTALMIEKKSYENAMKLLSGIDNEALLSANSLNDAGRLWKAVSLGFEKETPEWIECNLRFIESIMLDGETQRSHELKAQFLDEHGDVLSESWKNKFEAIGMEAGL